MPEKLESADRHHEKALHRVNWLIAFVVQREYGRFTVVLDIFTVVLKEHHAVILNEFIVNLKYFIVIPKYFVFWRMTLLTIKLLKCFFIINSRAMQEMAAHDNSLVHLLTWCILRRVD